MTYRNPVPTVDIIIALRDRPNQPIVLIERLNPPYGWAIVGGFVDYGERLEDAARREAQEETGLQVELIDLLGLYSDPSRDERLHTISAVYMAEAMGDPKADDDAKSVGMFAAWEIPNQLCFDHSQILKDYWRYRNYGLRPAIR
ncbi:ADP-ribose pyrophosphatase [Pseudanabaena sp. lw0831]|uniref:NUDIX domain-containing protein n=1 Tax=Pseudanabaena sp. lw0831 TaxID=1357935 RepID=UPI001915F5AE|nr:NUDIX hydrolase [Pseudanabaena sp. lw0831]GBO54711.1 ADP-ribose pyrophosphatase [Pseudanabaena sp. lw0831]